MKRNINTALALFLAAGLACLSACGGNAPAKDTADTATTGSAAGTADHAAGSGDDASAADSADHAAAGSDADGSNTDGSDANGSENTEETPSADTKAASETRAPENTESVTLAPFPHGNLIRTDTPVGTRVGERMEDFTFTTYDGNTYSLYETLATKDMVLINIWATWCGPCAREFPYMNTAYKSCQDQIEIFALSCEPTDTDDVLKEYVQQRSMAFPVGRDTPDLSSAFHVTGIPTSIVVDRFGTICYIEVGSMTSTDLFNRLFNVFTGNDYTESVLLDEIPPEETTTADDGMRTYTLSFTDQNGDPVAGVIVNICDDDTCTTLTTDSEGTVELTSPAFAYHVQVIKVPDGYEYDTSQETYLDPDGGTTPFTLTKK